MQLILVDYDYVEDKDLLQFLHPLQQVVVGEEWKKMGLEFLSGLKISKLGKSWL